MLSSNPERIYYSVRYRLDNKDRYLIWFTTADALPDGVVVGNDGTIPIFTSEAELLKYAEKLGITPPEEASSSGLLNFDVISHFLKGKKRLRAQRVDCLEFLNAWNMLDDIFRSAGGDFDSDKELSQKIYDKLFWGNNLPSITPQGKHYMPLWSGREMEILHEVFSQGFRAFRERTKLQIVR